MTACSCPQGPGRTITDPERHAAWHALVAEQGVTSEFVNAATLQAARGLAGGPASSTIVDTRAIASGKRVNGERRRAASASTYTDWLPQFLIYVQTIPADVEFTTADLHGKIPDPPNSNCWGRATAEAAKLRLIEAVATQESTLATTKSSLVRRWRRVAEAVAA